MTAQQPNTRYRRSPSSMAAPGGRELYDESDPLLLGRDGGEVPDELAPAAGQVLEELDERTVTQRLAILVPCLAILVCFTIGSFMIDIPTNEISEAIICRGIYGVVPDPASDARCKSTPVQSELALIGGWELTFGFIPSLLVGVPFGLAADKYGRRAVLLLTCIGGTLSTLALVVICRYPDTFPLRLRWLAPIFMLIGGGASTLNAMIYTIIADTTTQAQRSTAYLYLSAGMTACGLIASPCTYLMINWRGPWFTVYFGLLLVAVSMPLSALLPETRSAAAVKRAKATRRAEERTADASKCTTWWNVRPMLLSAHQKLSLINRTLFVGNPTVGLLLFSTLFITVGKSVTMMLLQYVTKRFGWSWAQAGLLLSVKNTASISLTAVVLPIISQLLLKIGMPPTIKDWWIVRVSAVISVAAALAMGLAPTVALFVSAMVFGESSGGLQAALRSVVTELVDQSHVALVMTVLSMSLTVSEMVAGPLMAETFKLGMELGGVLIGMPYLVSAALLSVGAVLLIWASMARQAKTTLDV